MRNKTIKLVSLASLAREIGHAATVRLLMRSVQYVSIIPASPIDGFLIDVHALPKKGPLYQQGLDADRLRKFYEKPLTRAKRK